ncbi:hypothetical protein NHQ30_002251 [Ciborinia camelliae]|nr:hypothetical protein NHQ30_002251 [Ciborinia camelliae]
MHHSHKALIAATGYASIAAAALGAAPAVPVQVVNVPASILSGINAPTLVSVLPVGTAPTAVSESALPVVPIAASAVPSDIPVIPLPASVIPEITAATIVSLVPEVPTVTPAVPTVPNPNSIIPEVPTVVPAVPTVPNPDSIIPEVPTVVPAVPTVPNPNSIIPEVPIVVPAVPTVPNPNSIIPEVPTVVPAVPTVPNPNSIIPEVPTVVPAVPTVPNPASIVPTVPFPLPTILSNTPKVPIPVSTPVTPATAGPTLISFPVSLMDQISSLIAAMSSTSITAPTSALPTTLSLSVPSSSSAETVSVTISALPTTLLSSVIGSSSAEAVTVPSDLPTTLLSSVLDSVTVPSALPTTLLSSVVDSSSAEAVTVPSDLPTTLLSSVLDSVTVPSALPTTLLSSVVDSSSAEAVTVPSALPTTLLSSVVGSSSVPIVIIPSTSTSSSASITSPATIAPTSTSASTTSVSTSSTTISSFPSTYTVQTGDVIWDIAPAHGLTVAELERLNPQIPNFDLIYPGQVINLGPNVAFTSSTPSPTSTSVSASSTTISSFPSTYTVQTGDVIWDLAPENGLTVAELERLNPQIPNFDLIYPGQVINVRSNTALTSRDTTTYPITVQPGDTLFKIAAKNGVSLECLEIANSNLVSFNSIVPGQTINVPQYNPTQSTIPAHTVIAESGDTLFKLAAEYGVSPKRLEAANPNIRSYDSITPGQAINIPAIDRPQSSMSTGTYIVQQGDTFDKIALNNGVSPARLSYENPDVEMINSLAPGQIVNIPTGVAATYCLAKKGDGLHELASKFGTSAQAMTNTNPQVKDPKDLYAGQAIAVPAGGAPTSNKMSRSAKLRSRI